MNKIVMNEGLNGQYCGYIWSVRLAGILWLRSYKSLKIVLQINARGQLRLSHKACSEDQSMQSMQGAKSAPELAGISKENA
jgi:hypothetical protein